MDKRTFSLNLRNRMNEAGIIQAELAARVGVSQQAASRWMTGASMPSSETLMKIAGVLCCETEDLINPEIRKLDHEKTAVLIKWGKLNDFEKECVMKVMDGFIALKR